MFRSDRACEVYCSLFDKHETVEGSCADYAAAADPEPQMQEEDQREGRKVRGDVLVMWSLAKLGKMHGDVGAIWREWVDDGERLEAVGVGEGVGHYLPEEASEFVAGRIADFVDKVTK